MQEFILTARIEGVDSVQSRKLLNLIKELTDNTEFYEFNYRPGYTYAVIDRWKAIGNINTILGICASAWTIYTGIADALESEKEIQQPTNIVVNIENAGQNNVINIGKEVKTVDDLKRLLDSLEVEKLKVDIEYTQTQIRVLRNSPNWKRTK